MLALDDCCVNYSQQAALYVESDHSRSSIANACEVFPKGSGEIFPMDYSCIVMRTCDNVIFYPFTILLHIG